MLILTITEKQLLDEELCNQLRQELLDAVTRTEARKIVVDLRFVEYVASVAFRPLLSLRRKVHDTGARMMLCNLSDFVADVFQATRLLIAGPGATAPFQEAADLTAAVQALGSGD